MADTTTIITGVTDGAFEKAFGALPRWASEETAKSIQKLIRKSLDVQTKGFDALIKNLSKGGSGNGAGAMSSGEVNKLNTSLEKLVKSMQQQIDDAAKEKLLRDKLKKLDDEKVKREQKKKVQDETWTRASMALIGAGTKILAIQKQYFKTSQDLFKSGVNLVSGQEAGITSMQSLHQVVVDTGLRLETFQKVIEKYSSSINGVGVTKFSKAIKSSTEGLIKQGYSSEQSAELIGAMIESESSYSDMRNKSSEQIAEDAERLGKNMTRLSMLTGQSSAQLQENMRALSKNTDSTVVSAQFGEKAAERMNMFANSFKDKDVGQMFQKLSASAQPEITKTFQDFASAGMAPLVQEFTRIGKAARDGQISATEANKQAVEKAKALNSEEIRRLDLLADAGVQGARETLEFVTKLRAQSNTNSTATEEQTDAAIASQSSLSRFSTALEKTASLGQRTLPLFESQVDAASKALEMFSATIAGITDIVSPSIRSTIGVIIEMAAGLALISKFIKPLTGEFDLFRSVMQKGGSTISNLFTRILPSLGNAARVATDGILKGSRMLGQGFGWVVNIFKSGSTFIMNGARMLGEGFGWVVNIFKSGSTFIMNAFRSVGSVFSSIGRVFTSVLSKFTGGISFIGRMFGTLGRWLANLANPITKLAAAFAVGWEIGTVLYSIISDFKWFTDLMDTIFGALDHIIKWIPGLGEGAEERIAAREKAGASTVQPNQVSAPTAPKQTPLANSSSTPPDGSKTTPEGEAKDSVDPQTAPAAPVQASPANTPASPEKNSINNDMSNQCALLAQLLEATNSLNSTNKDILKYTKAQA